MRCRLSFVLAVAIASGLTVTAVSANEAELKQFSTHIYISPYSEVKHLAELGDAESQYNLAWMYYGESGERRIADFPQNYRMAEHWYREAAEQGYAPAQHNLGLMLIKGQGTRQDVMEGWAWLMLAADHGHDASRDLLAIMEEDFGSAQRDRAQQVKSDLQHSAHYRAN